MDGQERDGAGGGGHERRRDFTRRARGMRKRVLNAGECLVPDVRVDSTSRRVTVGLSSQIGDA
jgi:hypothetical protein